MQIGVENMSYIILVARNIPEKLDKIANCARRELLHFLRYSKIIHLNKNDLLNRKSESNELVIIDQNYGQAFFRHQLIYYPKRLFLLIGKPFHVIPRNIIGFFETLDQLKENLIGYIEYLNVNKVMILNNRVSVRSADILCVEIKHRKLVVTTLSRTYNLGYKTLKGFMTSLNSEFYCVNRSIIVNINHVSFLNENKTIHLNRLERKIICSKKKYQNLMQNYKM